MKKLLYGALALALSLAPALGGTPTPTTLRVDRSLGTNQPAPVCLDMTSTSCVTIGSLVNGVFSPTNALNKNGDTALGTIAAPTFRAGLAPVVNTQGAYLGWNCFSNDGATCLLDQKGGGAVGGIKFGEADTSGNITPTGQFLTTGASVPFSMSVGITPSVVVGTPSIIDVHDPYPGTAGSSPGKLPDSFAAFAGGNFVLDYCSNAGCSPGPHLLTNGYIRGRSPGFNGAQNIALALDWRNDRGYLPNWTPNTTFTNTYSPNGSQTPTNLVQTGTGIYTNTVPNCVSAPSGAGPSGTGTGIVDGTCSWNYTNNANNAGGTVFSIGTRSMAGGGPQWGFATAHTVDPGFGNGKAIGQEFDCTNNNQPSYAGGGFGFVCLYFGGNNTFPSLAAIEIDNSGRNTSGGNGGGGGYQYGIIIDGQPSDTYSLALQGAFVDSDRAQYGFWLLAGRSHAAGFRDESNSTNVLSATGTHSGAGVDLSSATLSGTGLALPAVAGIAGQTNKINLFGNTLTGSYGLGVSNSSLDIVSASFTTIYSGGSVIASLSATGISFPNLATAGGTVKGTVCADTVGKIYVKITTGACI